jgi:hypothetical protein
MNHRKFLRETMKRELKATGRGLKKLLKQYKRKPTVHNQVCCMMGMIGELR